MVLRVSQTRDLVWAIASVIVAVRSERPMGRFDGAMTAVIPLTRDWRVDEVTDGGIQADVLANAPQAAHGFFAVPKVIE